MKKNAICPKCNSKKIGYLKNVINKTDSNSPSVAVGYPKAPVGITVAGTKKMFGLSITQITGVGELEAYFCTDCGFFETYVKNPEKLDFEQIEGFKML